MLRFTCSHVTPSNEEVLIDIVLPDDAQLMAMIQGAEEHLANPMVQEFVEQAASIYINGRQVK